MTLTNVAPYEDARGNRIIYSGSRCKEVTVQFRGSNNTLTIAEGANLRKGHFSFDCDNGKATVGTHEAGSFSAYVRVGQDATLNIGDDVTSTKSVTITCVEGQSVTIGNDCMFASDCQVRTDDAHAIFDVRTGKRVNPAKSVTIGNHVWLANEVVVRGGSHIGDGSVVGLRSVVGRRIPNNCVAVGAPARVTRRDIAWERPHLSLVQPFYKPDASVVTKSAYWSLTAEEYLPDVTPVNAGGVAGRFRRAITAFIAG